MNWKATLTFETRIAAYEFAESWSRFSLKGHSIGSGTKNVTVTLYDVDDEGKDFIDWYINSKYVDAVGPDQIILDQKPTSRLR